MLLPKLSEQLNREIVKFKEEKKSLENILQDKIQKNHQFFKSNSEKQFKLNEKIKLKRQKSIEIMQRKLQHKRNLDQQTNVRLMQMQNDHINKKLALQRKIQEINNRNKQRFQEIQQLEKTVIKKINQEIQKNQFRQKHLKQEYDRIRKQQLKIKQTKKYQKNAANHEWKIIINQKWNLQSIARQYEQKQQKLIQQKSPIILNKQKKTELKKQLVLPTEKQYKDSKKEKKGDSKLMGNQYLEQAKKIQKQIQLKKSKKKLMNVNLKMIGYCSEIMDKIHRNTGDLSKIASENIKKEYIKEQSESDIEASSIVNDKVQQNTEKKRKLSFELPDDHETQEYLRQIKINLQKIEKHENYKQPDVNFNQSNNPQSPKQHFQE